MGIDGFVSDVGTFPPSQTEGGPLKKQKMKRLAEVGEEGTGGAGEGASAEQDGGDGAGGLRISDADEAAGFGFVHRHFGNERDTHSRANHGEQAGEMAAFEDDAGIEARAITGRDGRVAEAVAIAKKQKRLGA